MMSREELLSIVTTLSPAELELLYEKMEIPVSLLPGPQAPPLQRAIEAFRFMEAQRPFSRLEEVLRTGLVTRTPPQQATVVSLPLGHQRVLSKVRVDARLTSEPAQCLNALHAAPTQRSPRGKVPATALRPSPSALSSGLTLSFNLSNPNRMDLGITALGLRVVAFRSAEFSGLQGDLGVAHAYRHICMLSPGFALYECEPYDRSYDFVKLSSGEMEFFSVDLQAQQAGVYEFEVVVQYSSAGHDGEVIGSRQRVGFFEHLSRPSAKPPLRQR